MRTWLLICWLVLSVSAWGQSKDYTLKPEKDDRLAVGTVAAVEGALPPSGLQTFILNDLTTMTPVEVGLVAHDEGPELTLVAFKRGSDKALKKATTGTEGSATVVFRTTDQACFQVQGPGQARYQLYAWVGPTLPAAPPLPKGMKVPEPLATPGTRSGPTTQASSPPASDASPLLVAIAVLLAAVLAMLVAIFVRLGRSRSAAAAGLLMLVCGLRGPVARAEPFDPDKTQWVTPIRPAGPSLWQRTQNRYNDLGKRFDSTKLKSTLDYINKLNDASGNLNPLNVVSILAAILGQYPLLSQGDIAPDLAHEGWPVLPDLPGDPNYSAARAEAQRIQGLLEEAYVIRLQTDLQARKEVAKMQLGASFHPILQVGASMAINSAAGPAAKMYAAYDNAVLKGMPKINQMLVIMARSQQDPYWYPQFGLPYYLFLYQRYAVYTRAF